MIAYLLLVHQKPAQFKRLFMSIWHPQNYYLIHIDRKSNNYIHNQVRNIIEKYSNVSMLDSHYCTWGGFSLVKVTLKAIKYLTENIREWTHFINLSGQDYPLETQENIISYLSQYEKMNFLDFVNIQRDYPQYLTRTKYYWVELHNKIIPIPIPRTFPKDRQLCAGSQWFILNREFCNYISCNKEVKRYIQFYKYTIIPDESFFHTIIMNSEFHANVVLDNKRFIKWENGRHPKILTYDDYNEIKLVDKFFARKFDVDIDSAILNILDKELEQKKLF